MKNIATAIKNRIIAGARWYAESWSNMDPAVAMGMYGNGVVAIPLTVSVAEFDAR